MPDMQTPQETLEIPGYQILEKIGEGGMGQVFRATQVSLQRTVAIKLLHPSLQGQSPLLAFHRESRLMASLAHPHVVAIHDCGQTHGQFYLVMEFVAGRPLRELMEPGQPWAVSRAAPAQEQPRRAFPGKAPPVWTGPVAAAGAAADWIAADPGPQAAKRRTTPR